MVQGKAVDLVGQRFGRLLVLRRERSETYGNSAWRCRCDCGNEKVTGTSNLKGRYPPSCGCISAEKRERKRKCSVDGCERQYRSKGLCDRHYARHFAATRDLPPEVTLERLKEVVSYDPATGRFTRVGGARSDLLGHQARPRNGDGYPRLEIDGRRYLCHILAWFYVYGVWPEDEIDHRDGDRTNNRIDNLREATRRLNAQNKRKPGKNNTSGYLGVSRRRKGWAARIKIPNGPYKYLGTFVTKERAYDAYVEAKRIYHEGCTI